MGELDVVLCCFVWCFHVFQTDFCGLLNIIGGFLILAL